MVWVCGQEERNKEFIPNFYDEHLGKLFCIIYMLSCPLHWSNLIEIYRRNIKLTFGLHDVLCSVLVFI
jgi:hypothetical protein